MGEIERPRRTQAGRDIDGNEMQFQYYGYNNIDAVENVIRYVTRSRANEVRTGDLIVYGALGAGYYLAPEYMVQQFLYVQEINGIGCRKGKRLHHEIFSLSDQDVHALRLTPEELYSIGWECSNIFFQMGYQVVFAVHREPEKGYHIHFAVNSVSFMDGSKFRTNQNERERREEVFNQILLRHQLCAGGSISAVYDLE